MKKAIRFIASFIMVGSLMVVAQEAEAQVLAVDPFIDVSRYPSAVWTKEIGIRIDLGPVPGIGPTGTWPESPHVVRVPSGSIILPDGTLATATNFLRMYYTGVSQWARRHILSAVSWDEGLTWQREPGVRVAVGAEAHGGSFSPFVLPLTDGSLRMYYSGGRERDAAIYYAESSDGLNWTHKGITLDTGSELNVFAPVVIPLAGGGYRMYYTASPWPIPLRIHSATSVDGIAWLKEGVRIGPGQGLPEDSGGAGYPYVIRLPDGKLKMYFEEVVASPTVAPWNSGMLRSAVSGNGLAWGVDSGVQIPLGATGSLDATAVFEPAVIQLSNGWFRMFYTGQDGSFGTRILSAIATPKVEPFSTFTATAVITFGPQPNDDSFRVNGNFTLSANSNGIFPPTETVVIEFGSFATTLPPGSFSQIGGEFKYEGNGVALKVRIQPRGDGSFGLKMEGDQANLDGTVFPVALKLWIHDDGGDIALKKGQLTLLPISVSTL